MRGKQRNSPLPALIAAAVVLALLAFGAYSLRNARSARQTAEHGKTIDEMMGRGEDTSEVPVMLNGKSYIRNPDLEAYLLMGIDRQGEAESTGSYNDGGQADVLLVLVLDHTNGAFTALQISRDTMTEVPVLDVLGKPYMTLYEQVALAHFYGNGLERSCENTVQAVSNLLYGMKIDGYAALNMDAIPVLNDLVGGVAVTIEDDFSASDPTLREGETVTLLGEHAYHYIHDRMNVGDGSNIARMRRHRTYLDAFSAAYEARADGDPRLIIQLYDALSPYLVTDMGSKTITRIAEQCGSYVNNGTTTYGGDAVLGEEFIEFYADERDLREKVIQLFYMEQQAPVGL